MRAFRLPLETKVLRERDRFGPDALNAHMSGTKQECSKSTSGEGTLCRWLCRVIWARFSLSNSVPKVWTCGTVKRFSSSKSPTARLYGHWDPRVPEIPKRWATLRYQSTSDMPRSALLPGPLSFGNSLSLILSPQRSSNMSTGKWLIRASRQSVC